MNNPFPEKEKTTWPPRERPAVIRAISSSGSSCSYPWLFWGQHVTRAPVAKDNPAVFLFFVAGQGGALRPPRIPRPSAESAAESPDRKAPTINRCVAL
ncbi:hypothetical protein CEXT_119621 [Caerostris extrusa]|uniref:Uncharacterized protein n=1 Tax=Caerostris extrusa TaxID=172846 RepID=A0AAV4NY62_CAEEX|nr:hypothetical protein CEXT_119621 [Caerostris extrusa]